MGTIELNLHKSYVKKTTQEANERGAKRFSGDDNPENWLRWEFEDDEIDLEVNLEENRLELSSFETPIGTISISIDLDTDDQLHILELMIKRLNKFKTMLESLR